MINIKISFERQTWLHVANYFKMSLSWFDHNICKLRRRVTVRWSLLSVRSVLSCIVRSTKSNLGLCCVYDWIPSSSAGSSSSVSWDFSVRITYSLVLKPNFRTSWKRQLKHRLEWHDTLPVTWKQRISTVQSPPPHFLLPVREQSWEQKKSPLGDKSTCSTLLILAECGSLRPRCKDSIIQKYLTTFIDSF